MKRKLIDNNKCSPHFIGSWYMEPSEICEDIINYFELNTSKQQRGRVGGGLDHNIKKSVDITIIPNEIAFDENLIFKKYLTFLFECYKDYIHQWPFLSTFANKVDIGSFNIQRYQIGEHFNQIHSERTSVSTLQRVFAWMTYLNDVEYGGGTYFSHYDLEIQPEKGLTLIWPAEWTHAHRGNILKAGSKYIITGWIDLSFPVPNDNVNVNEIQI
jgi:prolyl 4-hydroxylase